MTEFAGVGVLACTAWTGSATSSSRSWVLHARMRRSLGGESLANAEGSVIGKARQHSRAAP